MTSAYLINTFSCLICNSIRIQKDFTIHYWREHSFDFYACQDCHASFAHPMPSNEVISKGNNALVRHYQQNRSYEQEFKEGRQAYLRGRVLGQRLDRWKKGGKFLELGCYHAFVSLGVQEHSSWTAEGLEISSELADFINNTLKLKCHLGTLEEDVLESNKYDYVLCHDLIEHINNPKEFLSSLFQAVAPGGRVEIKTPNAYQDLDYIRRAYKEGITSTMLLNHILYFSPEALKIALESSGFKIKKLYCYDIRNSFKDFGYFGMGKPVANPDAAPSIEESLLLEEKKTLGLWNSKTLDQLRTHRKVSALYGFLKERLPQLFTLHMPYSLGVGHEIFAIAEKPVTNTAP